MGYNWVFISQDHFSRNLIFLMDSLFFSSLFIASKFWNSIFRCHALVNTLKTFECSPYPYLHELQRSSQFRSEPLEIVCFENTFYLYLKMTPFEFGLRNQTWANQVLKSNFQVSLRILKSNFQNFHAKPWNRIGSVFKDLQGIQNLFPKALKS